METTTPSTKTSSTKITGEIDQERWERLTAHLKVRNQPIESLLIKRRQETDKKAESKDGAP
jgi:hypothetical protein